MTGSRDMLLLVALFSAQVLVATTMLEQREQTEPIAVPPGYETGLAVSLGDGEFFFRSSALHLINAGVSGGQAIPLKNLDFARLQDWFFLLDRFDSRSNLVPVLAGYWFGFTQHRPDARYIVDYLLARAEIDPEQGWRWRLQAIYLAKHRIGDLDLAFEIAQSSAAIDDPNAPFFLKQMPAFVLEDMGEEEAALILLQSIMATHPELPDDEARFLQIAIDRISSTKQDE